MADQVEGGEDADYLDVVPRKEYEAVCRRLRALETDLAVIASVVGPEPPDLGGAPVRPQ